MSNIAQINDTKVSIISFKSIPVITTEMMADFYGTESKHIQNNFLRNAKRFIEGKHFFKIIGQELKEFKNQPSLRGLVDKRVAHLTLWTERGAARHAKMLDTDQAWDIFEQLEDCYFHRQEILAKTHKSERTALHEAHALLVTKTKHLNASQAWKLIHQRFNVNDVADIPYDAIPVAVEYVHHLIALYSNTEKQKVEPWCNKDVQFVMWYLPMLHKFIKNEVYPALKAIQSNYAGRLIGLSEEVVGHANALNRQSIEHGTTVLNHVNNKPVHTLEWYFKN